MIRLSAEIKCHNCEASTQIIVSIPFNVEFTKINDWTIQLPENWVIQDNVPICDLCKNL